MSAICVCDRGSEPAGLNDQLVVLAHPRHDLLAVMVVARHDRLVVTVSAREPSLIRSQRRLSRRAAGQLQASSAGEAIVQRIRPLGQPARHLAHDRNDLLYDITAGAAGRTSQQIPHRGADLRFGRPGPQTPNRPDLTLTLPRMRNVACRLAPCLEERQCRSQTKRPPKGGLCVRGERCIRAGSCE